MYHKGVALTIVLLALLVGFATQPAAAQQNLLWNVQYFNNPYLAAPAAISTTASTVAFNWGAGSPGNGVGTDNWTARFSTSTQFAAGTYRFQILADDGVHLYIDNNTLLINTFDQAKPGQTLTADITLLAGQHNIQLDYREAGGDAYVYLSWSNTGTPPTNNGGSQPNGGGNWTAQYFANKDLSGYATAIISEIGPSHNWGPGAPLANMPADNFSARWTSTPLLDGTYQITVRADDGVRVLVDNIPYINEWHGATGQTYTAKFTVSKGYHTITVEYQEQGGVAFLEYGLTLVTNNPGQINPTPPPVYSGTWSAQYFDNTSLSGTPKLTINENGPAHNWGTNTPANGIPADNFSARWSTTQYLDAGTYRMDVQADDGIRIAVDGIMRINEWHDSKGDTIYTATFTLGAGNHSIVVEYYEARSHAFIQYALTRVDTTQPQNPPTTGNTGASLRVATGVLNVRATPDPVNGTILTKVRQGENYAVVGRNADSTWWQINMNGTIGWVNGRYTVLSNIQNVPVTSSTTPNTPPASAFTLTTNVNLNLRSGSSAQYAILAVIPRGRSAQIVGRNASATWWKINYNGIVGWVNGSYVALQSGTDINKISIVSG